MLRLWRPNLLINPSEDFSCAADGAESWVSPKVYLVGLAELELNRYRCATK